MATISNLAAKWYVTRFPSSNPHKGSVYAAANLAGSNTFHGLAVSAATGALGPSNSFLQMKMIDEPDLFYLEELGKKVEEYEQEKEDKKEFGMQVRNYSYSAKRGPLLTNPVFLEFWQKMEHMSLLFRGTYSPKGQPDIWDPSFKAVIATSSDPAMADLFALKAFSKVNPHIEYTGHMYLLIVAPGVQYIDVKNQAIIPSLTGHIVHYYTPIFKSLVGPTIHEEDEYVLLSNPNVKIIFDSPLLPTATFKEHNEIVVPSFNHIVEIVLRNREIPIHNILKDISVPKIFKANPFLYPFERTESFNPEKRQDYHVTNMQFHIALYGFDGVIGGSRSVKVVGAPAGSNLTFETQSNNIFIERPVWNTISPTMTSPFAATTGGGSAAGGAGMAAAGGAGMAAAGGASMAAAGSVSSPFDDYNDDDGGRTPKPITGPPPGKVKSSGQKGAPSSGMIKSSPFAVAAAKARKEAFAATSRGGYRRTRTTKRSHRRTQKRNHNKR